MAEIPKLEDLTREELYQIIAVMNGRYNEHINEYDGVECENGVLKFGAEIIDINDNFLGFREFDSKDEMFCMIIAEMCQKKCRLDKNNETPIFIKYTIGEN